MKKSPLLAERALLLPQLRLLLSALRGGPQAVDHLPEQYGGQDADGEVGQEVPGLIAQGIGPDALAGGGILPEEDGARNKMANETGDAGHDSAHQQVPAEEAGKGQKAEGQDVVEKNLAGWTK